jgi:hypothetical protein
MMPSAIVIPAVLAPGLFGSVAEPALVLLAALAAAGALAVCVALATSRRAWGEAPPRPGAALPPHDPAGVVDDDQPVAA